MENWWTICDDIESAHTETFLPGDDDWWRTGDHSEYQLDVMARYTSLYVHYRVMKLPGEAVFVGGDNYASRRRIRKAKAHRLNFL